MMESKYNLTISLDQKVGQIADGPLYLLATVGRGDARRFARV